MGNKVNPHRKFTTPYRISALCKYCTPEKKGKQHNYCFVLNCICPHHPNWTAMHAREKGLRTIAKPGDPDYKSASDKPLKDLTE